MATLKDISQKAGVSISTVSRIVNDDRTKPASKETCDKVWKIVRELGYVPNQNARTLVKGLDNGNNETNTKTIGCIFASTKDSYADPFFSEIAKGIQDEASKQGYLMGYSFSASEHSNASLYNNITANKVDGAIILGRFSEDFLTFLKNNIKNLVYAGVNPVNAGFDEIICDGFKGTCCAVEHLISLGHKKIGYLGSVPGSGNLNFVNEHRFAGFKHTMEKYGLAADKNYIRSIEFTTEEGYSSMLEILDTGSFPTAIFCGNDNVAIGALKAIHEKGLQIPEDIAVIGFDDIGMSAYVRPSLTTIHIPKRQLGRFAVKMLIDRIEGEHGIQVRVDLPFHLVVRESCGGVKPLE